MKIKHVVLLLSVVISLTMVVYDAYFKTAIAMLLSLTATYMVGHRRVKVKNKAPRILLVLIIAYFTIGIVTMTTIITQLARILSPDRVFLLMVALLSIAILSILIEDKFGEIYNGVFGNLDPYYKEKRLLYFGQLDIYLITFEDDYMLVESLINNYRKRMDLGEFELFKKSEKVWRAFM